MRIRVFGLLSVLVLIPFIISAQCTPDTTFSGLYFSEFGDELPPARINGDYEAIIHIKVPKDTTVPGTSITISIDSGVITGVTGLPAGLDYECDQPRCSYPGGTYGCVRVFGVPTDTTQIGKNDLLMSIQVYTSIVAGPRDIDEFSILLEDDFPTNVPWVESESLNIRTTQNPMVDDGGLIIESSYAGNFELIIYSLLGEKEAYLRGETKAGSQTIELNDFALTSGVHFATVEIGEVRRSIRFIVR